MKNNINFFKAVIFTTLVVGSFYKWHGDNQFIKLLMMVTIVLMILKNSEYVFIKILSVLTKARF